jgi:hypothetical protein
VIYDEPSFRERVETVIRRYLTQNARAVPPPVVLEGIAGRLWTLVRERGLPRPLATQERGEPGGIPDGQCAELVQRVLAGENDPLLTDVLRQIVKACLHPEFKTCRDSFREVGADGQCRRQDLGRVLRRASGTHCVDCPHWVALTPEQHVAFLIRNWRAGAEDFTAHRDVYLPEDFRQLRRWLHGAARAGLAKSAG